MANLVTKFSYPKPSARQSRGGYARYIATRDGVEKLDDTQRLAPATAKQKQFIEKLLQDFPDCKEMLEYEDYSAKQTVGAASDFILRAMENNAHKILDSKTYADYIATRLRTERFGSHGLFTDDKGQPHSYTKSKTYAQSEKEVERKPPAANSNMRRVFAYLCQTGGIAPEVVSAFAHAHLLYESIDKHNAVFVGQAGHDAAHCQAADEWEVKVTAHFPDYKDWNEELQAGREMVQTEGVEMAGLAM